MQVKKIPAALAVLLATVAGVVYAAGGFDRLKDTVKIGQGTASDKVIEFDTGSSPNAKLTGLAAGTSISSSVNFSILDQGDLRLLEGSGGGSNYIALQAPSTLSGDTTYTLPADGAQGAFLQTNGSGTLSWLTPGTSTQLLIGQGATSSPTWNTVTGDVTIGSTGVTAIGSSKVTSTMITDGTIVNADVNASAAIAYSKLGAMATGEILLGNAGTPTATALSGDVTVGATGVAAIGTGVIVNADVNASAAIAYSKLATMSTGQVLLGNAGTPTATTLTGDVTVGATGVTAIASGVIVNADINASAAINGTKITEADSTTVGVVNTGAQTFAGEKTFNNGATTPTGIDFVTGGTFTVSGSGATKGLRLFRSSGFYIYLYAIPPTTSTTACDTSCTSASGGCLGAVTSGAASTCASTSASSRACLCFGPGS